MFWFLTEPHFARTAALCAQSALDEGIEIRTPLLDARVVALATVRPATERRYGGQTKLLLRTAMRGLLPDALLAPRAFKTGTLATYFAQSIRAFAAPMREAFRDAHLVRLGIARRDALTQVAERLTSGRGTWHDAEQLLSALQCEIWLESRLGGPEVLELPKETAVLQTFISHTNDPRVCATTPAALASGTSRQHSEGGL
jgi:asparagine synthase (glutamine-hydrolysing)